MPRNDAGVWPVPVVSPQLRQTYASADRLDRQKAALHDNILGKVRHAALPLQLPLLQHICAVGHELGEVDVLLGEYD